MSDTGRSLSERRISLSSPDGRYEMACDGEGIIKDFFVEDFNDSPQTILEIMGAMWDMLWMEAALMRRRDHLKQYPDDHDTPRKFGWPTENEFVNAKAQFYALLDSLLLV